MASGTTELAIARRLPARQRARLGWCAMVVMCAHVFVLAAPSPQAVALPAVAAAQPLQVRLLSGPAQRPLASGAALVPVTTIAETPRPVSLAPQAPIRSEPGVLASADTDVGYLPRAALTVGPRPQYTVVVDYPYFDGEADQYAGEFDVFIDDTGGVVRVASATPDLPGILANAVREAFLTARFSPGEVEGRPVRSRMRIEVTFDSRRMPSS